MKIKNKSKYILTALIAGGFIMTSCTDLPSYPVSDAKEAGSVT